MKLLYLKNNANIEVDETSSIYEVVTYLNQAVDISLLMETLTAENVSSMTMDETLYENYKLTSVSFPPHFVGDKIPVTLYFSAPPQPGPNLDSRIEELETENAALQSTVTELTARVEELQDKATAAEILLDGGTQ